ncbi:hypothetical protein LP52_21930 [Streptomonospora alba]|uniref:Protein kinase domain-containing protein n=1 Tax=Streptomonospora alba TaxID=183763 RepID=A0A0C2G0T0_9ACTN|nr:serine/threonine-protein kinase [Streptomonospora alba]KIH96928.1 hypothetical protein LP52_21930 [Streptomonospora alba]
MTDNGHERAKPLRTGDPHELGDYSIEGRLGRGGMGTVYLARDAADRQVAVKLIHPDLTDDPNFRRRFAREVESARKVARFSTAGVLDARLDGDPLLIVSEYVPGPNLAQAIAADGPMHGGTLESLALGVAAALTAIHRAGVIHRDLKPGNVLLSAVGPKVIDFGIARAMDDESAVTRSSQLMGTPSYLAPELIAGGEITPASDIFSWGCLVAYAGTGKAPFDAQTVPAVLHLISSGEADLEGLDPQLTDMIRSALEKDPRNRPTAQQLMTMLVGQEDPAEAVVDSTVVESWTPPSTAKGADAAGAAAAGAVGGALAGAAAAEAADGAEPGAGTEGGDGAAVPGTDEIPTGQSPQAPPADTGGGVPGTRPYTQATRPEAERPPSAPQAPYGHGAAPSAPGPSGPSGPSAPQGQQHPHGAQPGADAGYAPPGGFPPPAPQQPYGHPSGPQQQYGRPGPYAPYGPSGPQAPYGPGPQPGHQPPPYGPGSGPQQPPYGPGPTSSPPFGQPAAGYGGPGAHDGPGGASPGGPAPGKRRRTGLLLGAGAAVLLLVVGGVIGSVMLLGGGPPEGTLVYQDDFADGGWDVDEYDPEDEYLERAYHPDHGQILRVAESNSFDGSIGDTPPYEGEYPEAARVEADVEVLAGPAYSEFGVWCHLQQADDADESTSYEALVRFDGGGAELRRDGGPAGEAALATADSVDGFAPQPEGASPLESGGDKDPVLNTVTLTCEPDKDAGTMDLNLWVNGEHVLEALDPDLLPDDATEEQPRRTGLRLKRTGSEDDTPMVAFHRFELQRLGGPQTGGTAGEGS